MLVGYSDSEGEDDEHEPPAASAAAMVSVRALGGDDDDDDDDDDNDDSGRAAAELDAQGPEMGCVLPPAHVDEEDDAGDDDDSPAVSFTTAVVAGPSGLALPPPDLADFVADPAGRPTAPDAPRITPLIGERRAGSAAQIKSGFVAAVTRRDQLVAAKVRELAEDADARGRNYGLSSAYDSVFRASADDDDDDGADAKRQRTTTNRHGKVRTLSKKESARDAAMEASLRG